METLAGQPLHLGPGWAAFADPKSWLHYAIIMVLATASGTILAYHPVNRSRGLRAADIEHRKTLLIYSGVGALIALICSTTPSMAFVIFGIGGLMRFRTDVGPSKNTGHTMMATLIGLCWGLGLELVAAFATLYFWILVFFLEHTPLRELTVGGVPLADMDAAENAYRASIARAGGEVTSHSKRFKKQEMVFVVRLRKGVTLARIVEETATIPADLRGTADWAET